MNNTHTRATEIINKQVIYNRDNGTTYIEKLRRLCLNFICSIKIHNLGEQTIGLSKQ